MLEGIVRAKQDRLNLAGEAFTVLPVLMHGDAAFAGQGVVAETLNLSQLRGYRTGGTIHVVINNQVGFTTVAEQLALVGLLRPTSPRMIQAPIFHVNGDDPEAVRARGASWPSSSARSSTRTSSSTWSATAAAVTTRATTRR